MIATILLNKHRTTIYVRLVHKQLNLVQKILIYFKPVYCSDVQLGRVQGSTVPIVHSSTVKLCYSKLDGVGPLDNRPSTNKLHHFVQKKEKKEEKKM